MLTIELWACLPCIYESVQRLPQAHGLTLMLNKAHENECKVTHLGAAIGGGVQGVSGFLSCPYSDHEPPMTAMAAMSSHARLRTPGAIPCVPGAGALAGTAIVVVPPRLCDSRNAFLIRRAPTLKPGAEGSLGVQHKQVPLKLRCLASFVSTF